MSLPIKMIYPNNFEIFGRVENISRLGAYVEIDREIPVGIDIDVTLELPKYNQDLTLSGETRCKGSVFRCSLTRGLESKKYYGVGIFFTDFLKEVNRDKLSKYIDFLVLNEDKNIREGLKRWREKRDVTKMAKQTKNTNIKQREFQAETLNLLKQILSRLEEIYQLVKSPNPPNNS